MADGGEMNNVDEVPDDAYFHADFLPWHRWVLDYTTPEGDDDEEEEVVDDRCLPTCPKWQARVLRFVYRKNPKCDREPSGRSLRSIHMDPEFPLRQLGHTTLHRWFVHMETYHEMPFQTAAARKELRESPAYKGLKRKKIVNEAASAFLSDLCKRQPDTYLDEYQDALVVNGHGFFSVLQVSRALRALRLTRKVVDRRSDRQDAGDQAAFKFLVSAVPDPAQLLFMDEKGKNRYSTRRRWGRAPYGERAIIIERFMRSSKYAYSFIAAADINGYVSHACQLYWRPRPKGEQRPGEHVTFTNVTAAVFEFHMKYLVAPYLGNAKRGEPRSVLVLDNASWHNKAMIEEIVAERGARVIFTPVCSPWLNPIEFSFSVYAQHLKRFPVETEGFPDDVRARVHERHVSAMQDVTRSTMIGIYKSVGFISNVPNM